MSFGYATSFEREKIFLYIGIEKKFYGNWTQPLSAPWALT